jgi:hypothetical protein
MSKQSRGVDRTSEEDGRTFTEQIDIAASELVDRTKELIEEGNVRRIIIRNQDSEVLMEVPLTAGVVVGGALHHRGAGAGRLGRVGGPADPREGRGSAYEERRKRW